MMITPNNIPQGYKATPLGIIPQEWEVRRFRDVGNFLRNNTLSRDKMSESDGCVQNIHYGDVLIKYREILNVSRTNIPWIVENSKDSSLGDMLQDGDIVISDTAEDYTVGKATELLEINGASVVAGLHTMPFRPLANLFSPCFLGYYINSMAYRFQLYALIQGIKVCAISKKAMSGTFLIVPPLAEQKKIAEVLGVWDKAIEKQSHLIEQLTLRKRGLMQQLLTAKRRLPGFSGRWEDVELGEVLTYEQPTPYIVRDTNYQNGYKTPVLTAGKTFILGYTNEDCGICNNIPVILFDDFTTDSRYIDFEFKVKSSAIKLLRVKGNDNLYFIYCALRGLKYVVGGHERHWISKFQYLTISLPSIEEQTAIAQVLIAADREIELAQQKLELLRQQKRGLMQQLLTGKKRVKY